MCNSNISGATALAIVALLLIVDIVLFVYSVYCLFDCVQNHNLNVGAALLIGLLLFVPGLGVLPSIGIIVYHHVYCKDKHTSPKYQFRFY